MILHQNPKLNDNFVTENLLIVQQFIFVFKIKEFIENDFVQRYWVEDEKWQVVIYFKFIQV